MKWVTREHPRTDRIACPWLIRRFIDTDAEIVYVATLAVIGSGALATRYAAALDSIGCETRITQGDAAARGLFAIGTAIGL